MKKNQKKATVSITEQAATWHVELDESEHLPDRRRRFFSWLRKSPQHIEEFLAIAALQQTIAQPSQHSGSIAEIVHDVSKAKQEPVVAMRPDVAEKPEVPVQDPPSRRWRPVVWASAACVAMLATFLVLWLPAADAPPRNHRTELGEQRSIARRDGSIVTLNT
jgi:transmembrane sensor